MRPPFKKTPVAVATTVYLNSLRYGPNWLTRYLVARDIARDQIHAK